MELLAFLILAYAIKSAIDDTRGALHKSRTASASGQSGHAGVFRHDLGFYANQIVHGFPQARHGFMRGWDQASKAHNEAMAGRQKAKTDRLEHHAGLIPQLTDYRTRQQAALTKIQASQAPDPATTPGQPAGQEGGQDPVPAQPGQNGDGYRLKRRPPDFWSGGENSPQDGAPPAEGGWSYGTKGMPSAWPTDDPGVAHRQAQSMSTGGSPQQVHRYPVKGQPGVLEATYLNGKPETPASTDTSVRWGPLPGEVIPETGPTVSPAVRWHDPPSDGGTRVVTENGQPIRPAPANPAPAPDPQPSTSAPAEGNNGMATNTAGDVTYDGVQRDMTQAMTDAEARHAEADAGAKQASETADQMQGLEMDPGTLGAMADHLDAWEALKAAAAKVMETAETVQTTMARGHSGLNEAHQNAPVEAATKPFYGEG
jgi:hypothetical protein